ncbi:MAG: 2Fe-2S iron-sulfur cluster-binding protein, partial [Syntrophorhabdus sp.]
MRKARVLFLPSQTEIKGEIGRTVLDLAQEAGVYIDSHCKGKGKCGKCRLR